MTKNCYECRHYVKERTGPHEWRAGCALRMADFLSAADCAYYIPISSDHAADDSDDRWPFSAEVTALPSKPAQEESALAHAHWGYVETVLKAHGESPEVIAKCGRHYRTAFDHGFKHGKAAR